MIILSRGLRQAVRCLEDPLISGLGHLWGLVSHTHCGAFLSLLYTHIAEEEMLLKDSIREAPPNEICGQD